MHERGGHEHHEERARSAAEFHSAGAIVRHAAPFGGLEVAQIFERPPRELIDRWIKPFYMHCFGTVGGMEEPLAPLYGDLDEELVRRLLSYFDWRPRIVGGGFAALRGLSGVEEFEQLEALAALRYLDEVNGTRHAQDVMPHWHAFARSKPGWNLDEGEQRFREQLTALGDLAARLDAR